MQSKYQYSLVFRSMTTSRVVKSGMWSHRVPSFHFWHSFFAKHCVSFATSSLSIYKHCTVDTVKS